MPSSAISATAAAGPWERVDVSDWPIYTTEPSGSSIATWLEEPNSGHLWLHKDIVIPDNGIAQGEDWSEVVSTEVAVALGVPCATTRLCVRHGQRGSISLHVDLGKRAGEPSPYSVNEGTVALERCASVLDYFPHLEGEPGQDPSRPDVRRPGHSLANIKSALCGLSAPPGFLGPDQMDAFDVFAGYLLLDALIANRDRHEQNWAILTPQLASVSEALSPSYDHASSVGYNLPPAKRHRLAIDPKAFLAWVEKGTAYRFEHVKGQPVTLVQHAVDALDLGSEIGRGFWRAQVASLDLDSVTDSIASGVIPELSEDASSVASNILRLNHERISHEL